MTKQLYSTHEVARMLGVHYTSIIKWVEEARLKAYTTPGGHRRLEAESIIAFCEEYNMRVPDELEVDEKVKILIADDDERILDVFVDTLKQASDRYEIYTATDGFNAGLTVRDIKPALVVLDIFLPQQNGITVCGRLKKDYPDMKIIAVTGHGGAEVKDQVINAGADAFLEKPFDIPVLVEKVETLLSKSLST